MPEISDYSDPYRRCIGRSIWYAECRRVSMTFIWLFSVAFILNFILSVQVSRKYLRFCHGLINLCRWVQSLWFFDAGFSSRPNLPFQLCCKFDFHILARNSCFSLLYAILWPESYFVLQLIWPKSRMASHTDANVFIQGCILAIEASWRFESLHLSD